MIITSVHPILASMESVKILLSPVTIMTNVLLILVALRTVVFTQQSAAMIEMNVLLILVLLLLVVLIPELPVMIRMLVLKIVAALIEDVS
jgi:hypothetical protein